MLNRKSQNLELGTIVVIIILLVFLIIVIVVISTQLGDMFSGLGEVGSGATEELPNVSDLIASST